MNDSRSSILTRRPAAMALLLYIAGILFSLLVDVAYPYPLIIALFSLFGALAFYIRNKADVASYLTATLIFSLGWYLTALSNDSGPANHISKMTEFAGKTQVAGKIIEEPDYRIDRTFLVVDADSLLVNGTWVSTVGKLRAKIAGTAPSCGYSDYVKISGFLYTPPGPGNPRGFDYGQYLRMREIYAAMSVSRPENIVILARGSSFISNVVTPLRDYLLEKTKSFMAAEEAAVLSGFILGEQQNIPEETREHFRRTGTMHLMAVSGSNVGIVLALFTIPLTLLRVPRKIKVIVLLVTITFFAVLTRLQPSVVRATIMAFVGLIAYGWVRKPDYVNLLCFTGLLMLLWHPLGIFDIGVQLSFAATFALVYALPRALALLAFLNTPHYRWLYWIGIALISTLAAQIAVLPVIAHHFQRLPLLSLFANIPVGFLAALSSMIGIAFYVLSILGGWFSSVTAFPLEFILGLTLRILGFFSSLPYAEIRIASPGWLLMVLYWLLLYFVWEMISRKRFSKRALVAALVILNASIWGRNMTKRPDWSLEFLDLGRNRAWLFTIQGRTLGCYDCYDEQDNAENLLIPHLLNHHDGRLEYLMSSTLDSPDVGRLASAFSPIVIDPRHFLPNSPSVDGPERFGAGYLYDDILLADIKVIWDRSDNNVGKGHSLPAIQINVENGTLLLAGWTGMGTTKEHKDSTILLEMPWSAYAQSACLKQIEMLNPRILVFSPDLYSIAAPNERSRLTHSDERLLSTSICGALMLNSVDGAVNIQTMKACK